MPKQDENSKGPIYIDYAQIFRQLKAKGHIYLIVVIATVVISSALILCVPRYYKCTITLAPESDVQSAGGSLASMASSFLGNKAGGTDAIYPMLYPDLMSSKDFLVGMFPVKVKSLDGKINTDYFDYLAHYQKSPWWAKWRSCVINFFKGKKKRPASGDKKVNPFSLTQEQDDITNMINGNIKCSVDKKTDVISISVTDQDKLICATMADSARVKLQAAITNYRTSKARNDVEYYEKLAKEAYDSYTAARRKYASFSDANTDLVLTSYKAKEEDLENDMQLKYNTYTDINERLQVAKAKVQERTPAFTVLQGATVPLKPSGPKRMAFVFIMTVLAVICTTTIVLRKTIVGTILRKS